MEDGEATDDYAPALGCAAATLVGLILGPLLIVGDALGSCGAGPEGVCKVGFWRGVLIPTFLVGTAVGSLVFLIVRLIRRQNR
jgi:hypothetical protein